MILAAPFVLPFAEAVGISIATLGMAKAADMVNDYIQENPEQSIKILSTIVPGVGIGEIFMKKGKDEEVEEEVEVEDVDARDLTRAEKAKEMKRRFKEGTGDKREIGKKGYEEIILPGKEDEMLDEAEDRYDGGVEEVSKPKFDYKKFFKKRYADGGAIGIEVLFEKKKDGGRAGSTMKPKRGLVNEPGGYAGLTAQQQAFLNLQLQNDPEYQTGFYKATPELKFEDFYKAPTGPLRYVDEVQGSNSYFDENIDNVKFEPRGPLRDLDMDKTVGIIDALDTKDPSGELGFDYMDRLKTNPDGTIYETIQTNTPKFAEFQQTPMDQINIVSPKNFQNLKSTNKDSVYGYTTLPDILPSEYGTKFQTETNPVYLNKDLAEFITTKPMSPANQLPLYTDKAAQLGFYGAKPVDLLNQAVDTVQHEYAHNITKFPQFANVMKNTMDAGVPSQLQLKGKPGDGISKFDKEELFTRALDIERRLQKDGDLNSPNVDTDLRYMNQVLGKKYKNLNKDGQSMAIQYLNSIRPQVKDYFNTINQQAQLANTANRARAANPDVYASADRQGFTDGRGGGFASRSTGTNENFSNKTGRGRTGYDDGGRVGLFMGGSPLDGQALSIYNSMNAYGFSDQEIANALQEQGLYTPGGSTPDPTPDTGQTIGYQGGNDGPVSLFGENLNPTFSKDLSEDPRFNYLEPTAQANKYRFDRSVEPREGLMGFFDKVGNKFKESKFFQPRIKGTLGDRLLKQSQGMTIPSFATALGKLRSPFNPNSPTYNAALPMQLNFLEATTGKKIGGTSKDGLTITEGLDMIGRDPNSGLLKYGSGSVLAGKNVISGFGSNDYETALNKYLSRMLRYENPTKFQAAKIKQAQDELKALQAKKEQEYIDSGTQAEVKALQKEIDSGKYSGGSDFAQSNQAAVGGGSTARNKQGQTAAQATKAGTGTAQGYSQHFARGGLATMFVEKR